MTSSFERRLLKLEAEITPRHRHQGNVYVPFGEDPAPYIEAASRECRAAGCTYSFIIVYTGVNRDNWADAVQEQYEGLDARGEMGG